MTRPTKDQLATLKKILFEIIHRATIDETIITKYKVLNKKLDIEFKIADVYTVTFSADYEEMKVGLLQYIEERENTVYSTFHNWFVDNHIKYRVDKVPKFISKKFLKLDFEGNKYLIPWEDIPSELYGIEQ